MGKRSYTHTQILLPEIRAMVEAGKTQREIAEHFGFLSKEVVRELLKRERRKEAKLAAGTMPRPKGRPRKDALLTFTILHKPSSPAGRCFQLFASASRFSA